MKFKFEDTAVSGFSYKFSTKYGLCNVFVSNFTETSLKVLFNFNYVYDLKPFGEITISFLKEREDCDVLQSYKSTACFPAHCCDQCYRVAARSGQRLGATLLVARCRRRHDLPPGCMAVARVCSPDRPYLDVYRHRHKYFSFNLEKYKP